MKLGANEANARKVLAVLNDFGMGSLGIDLAELTQPGQVSQLGYPPGRIDLLTSMDGVWRELIGVDDFKKNKRATGRLKDLADLQTLQGKS